MERKTRLSIDHSKAEIWLSANSRRCSMLHKRRFVQRPLLSTFSEPASCKRLLQNRTETQHVYARFIFVEPLILLCSDQNLLPCERPLYRTLRRVYVPLLPKPLAANEEVYFSNSAFASL